MKAVFKKFLLLVFLLLSQRVQASNSCMDLFSEAEATQKAQSIYDILLQQLKFAPANLSSFTHFQTNYIQQDSSQISKKLNEFLTSEVYQKTIDFSRNMDRLNLLSNNSKLSSNSKEIESIQKAISSYLVNSHSYLEKMESEIIEFTESLQKLRVHEVTLKKTIDLFNPLLTSNNVSDSFKGLIVRDILGSNLIDLHSAISTQYLLLQERHQQMLNLKMLVSQSVNQGLRAQSALLPQVRSSFPLVRITKENLRRVDPTLREIVTSNSYFDAAETQIKLMHYLLEVRPSITLDEFKYILYWFEMSPSRMKFGSSSPEIEIPELSQALNLVFGRSQNFEIHKKWPIEIANLLLSYIRISEDEILSFDKQTNRYLEHQTLSHVGIIMSGIFSVVLIFGDVHIDPVISLSVSGLSASVVGIQNFRLRNKLIKHKAEHPLKCVTPLCVENLEGFEYIFKTIDEKSFEKLGRYDANIISKLKRDIRAGYQNLLASQIKKQDALIENQPPIQTN